MKRLVPLTLVALLFLAIPAEAGKYGKQIGSASAQGDYAVATASGSAKHPRALYMEIISSPPQTVDASYLATCSKGSGAGSRSGDFTAQTPVIRKLAQPYARPDDCDVAASAQLQDVGDKIIVTLYSSAGGATLPQVFCNKMDYPDYTMVPRVRPRVCNFHKRESGEPASYNTTEAYGVRWRSWNSRSAYGVGHTYVNSIGRVSLTIRLTRPRSVCGRTIFTRGVFSGTAWNLDDCD